MENDFLRSVSKACGIESLKTQVEENLPRLSVNRQLRRLLVPRSSYYCKSQKKISKVASDERAQDEIMDIFYDTPFYASFPFYCRIETAWIQHQPQTQFAVCEKALGLRTIYSCPHFNTSEPHPEHKKFPYLLKGLEIDHPNQVWSTDITYTAVNGHRAFVIAIEDWFSRKLMAYNVVNTMDAFHCVETLQMAIERFGKPEIFNSDQGSQ